MTAAEAIAQELGNKEVHPHATDPLNIPGCTYCHPQFVKTVFDAKTGELLGAHMIGAEVTELIQGYTIGKTAELVETDFVQTVFPHPTLSEMMHESVLAALGRVVHI